MTGQNTFLQRIIGAMALDAAIYEEVEADRGATSQAFTVVILSSIAAGIGARGFAEHTVGSLALGGIAALMAWAAWALVTYQIGGRLMPERETRTDVGELLRTIGFATAPGLLRAFGALPRAAVPVFAITSVWMLLAMVVAVRQALDYRSTLRAFMVCVIGWILAVALVLALGLIGGSTVS